MPSILMKLVFVLVLGNAGRPQQSLDAALGHQAQHAAAEVELGHARHVQGGGPFQDG